MKKGFRDITPEIEWESHTHLVTIIMKHHPGKDPSPQIFYELIGYWKTKPVVKANAKGIESNHSRVEVELPASQHGAGAVLFKNDSHCFRILWKEEE